MDAKLSIESKDSETITEVHFSGNMDTNTAPGAQGELNALIEAGKIQLVINFEALNFISSAGLRVLLATAKRLKRENGGMAICHLNETVQEVFDISGFISIFNVFQSQEEAANFFS